MSLSTLRLFLCFSKVLREVHSLRTGSQRGRKKKFGDRKRDSVSEASGSRSVNPRAKPKQSHDLREPHMIIPRSFFLERKHAIGASSLPFIHSPQQACYHIKIIRSFIHNRKQARASRMKPFSFFFIKISDRLSHIRTRVSGVPAVAYF